jgi:hypothetical protein
MENIFCQTSKVSETMKAKNLLVIVDMQPKFPYKEALVGVLKEIEIAKREKKEILVLEYAPLKYGRTAYAIKKALKDYPHLHRRTKYYDDGSLQVDIYADTYEFVGVYFQHCVWDTAIGVAQNHPLSNVKIIRRATNRSNSSWDTCKRMFYKWRPKNLEIVPIKRKKQLNAVA